MKKTGFALAFAAVSAIACNNEPGKDSVAIAKAQNEAKDSSVTLLGIDTDTLSFDKDFLVEAASGGMLEVELGKIAQTNATTGSVKNFGKMMVTDHTKANEELKSLARAKNITVPAAPGETARQQISDLRSKRGTDFDKAYTSLMAADHKDDINAFEKAAQQAKDPEIQAFAAKTLPTLKAHLQKIQDIQATLR